MAEKTVTGMTRQMDFKEKRTVWENWKEQTKKGWKEHGKKKNKNFKKKKNQNYFAPQPKICVFSHKLLSNTAMSSTGFNGAEKQIWEPFPFWSPFFFLKKKNL